MAGLAVQDGEHKIVNVPLLRGLRRVGVGFSFRVSSDDKPGLRCWRLWKGGVGLS